MSLKIESKDYQIVLFNYSIDLKNELEPFHRLQVAISQESKRAIKSQLASPAKEYIIHVVYTK